MRSRISFSMNIFPTFSSFSRFFCCLDRLVCGKMPLRITQTDTVVVLLRRHLVNFIFIVKKRFGDKPTYSVSASGLRWTNVIDEVLCSLPFDIVHLTSLNNFLILNPLALPLTCLHCIFGLLSTNEFLIWFFSLVTIETRLIILHRLRQYWNVNSINCKQKDIWQGKGEKLAPTKLKRGETLIFFCFILNWCNRIDEMKRTNQTNKA